MSSALSLDLRVLVLAAVAAGYRAAHRPVMEAVGTESAA